MWATCVKSGFNLILNHGCQGMKFKKEQDKMCDRYELHILFSVVQKDVA